MRASIVHAALLGLGLLSLALPAESQPRRGSRVVERVVALVDGRPVWLSELRDATRPFENMLRARTLSALERARSTRELRTQVLERLIDRRLATGDAARAKISVSDAEIDAALDQIARANGTSPAAVYAEAAAQGFTQKTYRAEIAATVLEGKLLRLWMARRSLETPSGGQQVIQEKMASYAERWRTELRKSGHIERRYRP